MVFKGAPPVSVALRTAAETQFEVQMAADAPFSPASVRVTFDEVPGQAASMKSAKDCRWRTSFPSCKVGGESSLLTRLALRFSHVSSPSLRANAKVGQQRRRQLALR